MLRFRQPMPGPISLIIDAVSHEFGITRKELLGESHEPKFSHPRILAIALAKELTKAYNTTIGRKFGRHQSTVIHAIERAPNLIDLSPQYLDRRKAVLRKLRAPAAPQS